MGNTTIDLTSAVLDLVNRARVVNELIEPRGYPHLGLAVIDAALSLRADYDTAVVPALAAYCNAAPGITWDTRFDTRAPEYGAVELVEFLGPKTSDERCALLTRRVAPGTSTRKADLIVDIAETLLGCGIATREELATTTDVSTQAERAVRRLHGVGPATWRYLLNLSGVERTKPDIMITRWVRAQTGTTISATDAADAVDHAVRLLQPDDPDLTVRTVDHLIWRATSGRIPSLRTPP